MDKNADFAPLNANIVRALSDKLYEKRKVAALEIEKIVRQLQDSKDSNKIAKVITLLRQDFAFSANGNNRKGGLIGLAATAIALGQSITFYLEELIPPVLSCFSDQDSRVRYYACESLFNISKVARGDVLPYFNEIFDGLSKLSADPDLNVKNGAELLDRLIKDVVTESTNFDVEKFIPLLKERINTVHPYVRQFLVNWIITLDSVQTIDMLFYLPHFLDGLFKILSEPSKEIRKMTETALGEFLREIKTAYDVNFAAMVEILVKHCLATDYLTQLTALNWIREFIGLAKRNMVPFNAKLLSAILPCLAHENDEIRDAAVLVNKALMKLISDTEEEISTRESQASGSKEEPADDHINATVDVLTHQFINESVETRVAALRWILMLHSKAPKKIVALVEELFPALLKTLSDFSDKVVLLDLEVLAEITSYSPNENRSTPEATTEYFLNFMRSLLSLFSTDRMLMEKRGPFIIRQLCLLLNPDKIFRALADILLREEDLEFASRMVQSLTLILLTAPELTDFRQRFKNLEVAANQSLFETLYNCWCHNPVSTFALCYLAQVYPHACDLIQRFGDLDVTASLLVEVDKLIQLLESPIFTYLRLQLLEPERHPFLVKSLYGLLMLLPQSAAFKTLYHRLKCIPNIYAFSSVPAGPKSPAPAAPAAGRVDFGALLAQFDAVQKKHALPTRKARADRESR
ncbi:HEAT repeat-containing protein [Capsaspora owczarzaki ATCC 30864]|uniref:HEAT repeat-containing protein n=1 Tax=Capsaspora owczarzaki (strain ATCC 30864) TaxID=595528 RepID=A0A0D2WU46_CAPO3|nr:HEAT repeat-containing protein [Capsaspora owczarzaki ATCC 30864]KJE95353.1 HEAT repeat-containing protein [Capsaspora owczarzaki ATCC 30864]|eukprot:XP_004345398.1 HEAT repeat-containing protein [Capsaspora owczarzaki ATCC 30864]